MATMGTCSQAQATELPLDSRSFTSALVLYSEGAHIPVPDTKCIPLPTFGESQAAGLVVICECWLAIVRCLVFWRPQPGPDCLLACRSAAIMERVVPRARQMRKQWLTVLFTAAARLPHRVCVNCYVFNSSFLFCICTLSVTGSHTFHHFARACFVTQATSSSQLVTSSSQLPDVISRVQNTRSEDEDKALSPGVTFGSKQTADAGTDSVACQATDDTSLSSNAEDRCSAADGRVKPQDATLPDKGTTRFHGHTQMRLAADGRGQQASLGHGVGGGEPAATGSWHSCAETWYDAIASSFDPCRLERGLRRAFGSQTSG